MKIMEKTGNVLMRINGNRSVELVRDKKVIPWYDGDWAKMAGVMSAWEEIKLEPAPDNHDRQKSFYGKAHVLVYKDQFVKAWVLKSYSTYVCAVAEDLSLGQVFMRLRAANWSNTTVRHIISFLYSMEMEGLVRGILNRNTKEGGFANRLTQLGDIVIVMPIDRSTPISWWEHMKEAA